MKYDAIIFDLDGTLLDTLDDLADCMNSVLRGFNMPVHPVDPYRYYVGDGMENLARRAAPAGTPDSIIKKMAAAMGKEYGDGWAKKTRPYAGIAELLDALSARGLRQGVLSNKPDPFTQVMVKYYFREGLFAAVFGARDNVPKKPDPAAALDIAASFAIPPARTLYIGDTNTDMKTGRSAGMFTVGAAWGFRPVEELLGAGAQVIVKHPAEVLALL